MQVRAEEIEELWGDFRDVVQTLYYDPMVVAKMESKLKRGFMDAASRSGPALKAWLEQFVKAGRLSLSHIQGSKQLFSAAWCAFVMLLPRDAVPDEEFEQRPEPELPIAAAGKRTKQKALGVQKVCLHLSRTSKTSLD